MILVLPVLLLDHSIYPHDKDTETPFECFDDRNGSSDSQRSYIIDVKRKRIKVNTR